MVNKGEDFELFLSRFLIILIENQYTKRKK